MSTDWSVELPRRVARPVSARVSSGVQLARSGRQRRSRCRRRRRCGAHRRTKACWKRMRQRLRGAYRSKIDPWRSSAMRSARSLACAWSSPGSRASWSRTPVTAVSEAGVSTTDGPDLCEPRFQTRRFLAQRTQQVECIGLPLPSQMELRGLRDTGREGPFPQRNRGRRGTPLPRQRRRPFVCRRSTCSSAVRYGAVQPHVRRQRLEPRRSRDRWRRPIA